MITMYTDGSFNTNQNVGGWAAIIVNDGTEIEYSGSSQDNGGLSSSDEYGVSAQRMEIIAVLEGLLKLTEPSNVEVISDSKYVVDTMSKGWLESWIKEGKKDKKHFDLWRVIYTLSKLHDLKFTWVKGHAGNHYNERCDFLAQRETKKLVSIQDIINNQHEDDLFEDQSPFEDIEVNINTEVKKSSNNVSKVKATKKKTYKSKTKKKEYFYAVAKGRKKGVFNTWNECSKSVNKYRGAIFKKFDTEEKAEKFIKDNS